MVLIATTLVLTSFIQTGRYFAYAAYTKAPPSAGGPTFKDPKLKAEVVFTGLDHPTSMAFLGPNDILVLQKNTGTVQRIVNGRMLPQPLLHVNVGQGVEWGMLGIAVARHKIIIIMKTKMNLKVHMFSCIILNLRVIMVESKKG